MWPNPHLWAGSLSRTDSEDVAVSYWNIPRGTDYHLAEPVTVYFPTRETAERFCEKHSGPPEMAHIMHIT